MVLNTTWNLLNLSRMRPSVFGHGLQAFFFAVVFALETLAEGLRWEHQLEKRLRDRRLEEKQVVQQL